MSRADSPDAPPATQAWRDFCRRIEALGERILEDDFPGDEEARAEGIAHLADQVSCWLGWSIGHTDPRAPFFHRSNDLVTQWGGPNQDNVYHHASIDPSLRYRIRGHMHSCEDFVLTLRAGFMHMPVWGTRATLRASERGIRRGEPFEILLGGDGSDPEWLQIPEGVVAASLREYYVDWQNEEPAVFTIECLDDAPAPARPSGAQVAERLQAAYAQVENSILYWNDYMRDGRAQGVDNEFAMPMKVAKGLAAARYAFCFWRLEEDQALLLESDVPEADYWGLQLYNEAWFEQIDPIHRVTSINQAQMAVDDDGRFRLVLSQRDPGVPNWLECGGHRRGLLTYRWFWPKGDPTFESRVLPVTEVRDCLPPGSPTLDAAARREEIRRRKQHLAWRFRT